MAAHKNHELTTLTAEEPEDTVASLPVVKVIHIWEKNSVELWFDEYGKTVASTNDPYNFKAVNKIGKEPLIKTYGSLTGCDKGKVTIGEHHYRIQVVEQQPQLQVSHAIPVAQRGWVKVTKLF